MIKGWVNAQKDVLIPIRVLGPLGQEQDIEAIIDTGFDDCLCLPQKLVDQLGLHWLGHEEVTVGDGSVSEFEVYTAVVEWDGQLFGIPVQSADVHPLVGMNLLEGYELNIEVKDGGGVTITALV